MEDEPSNKQEILLLIEYILSYLIVGMALYFFLSELILRDPAFLVSSIVTFFSTILLFIFHIFKTHQYDFTKFIVHVLLFSSAATSFYYLIMFFIGSPYFSQGLSAIIPIFFGAIVLPFVMIGSLFIEEKNKLLVIAIIWFAAIFLFLVWFSPIILIQFIPVNP